MKVLRRAWVSGIIFSIIFVFVSCLLAQEAEKETPAAETAVAANVAVEPAAAVTPTSLPVPAASTEPATTVAPIEPAAPSETGLTGANAATAESAVSATPAEAKPAEWVWGEVVSVDTENKQIVLKHLDYDTYEEVQITIKVGDKTLFENVAALGDIKAGNHLTADFKIVAGSNIADLIVVEKEVQEESVVPETAVESETAVAPEIAVKPAPEPEAPKAIVPEAPAAIPEQAVNETKLSI